MRLRALFYFGWILALTALTPAKSRADAALFTAQKCNNCHSITAAGVEVKKDPAEEADEEESKPVDLSHVGSFHDTAFLQQYLMKETNHTPHDGNSSEKKHKLKFKGSDDELKKLVEWLAGLK